MVFECSGWLWRQDLIFTSAKYCTPVVTPIKNHPLKSCLASSSQTHRLSGGKTCRHHGMARALPCPLCAMAGMG